MPFVSSAVGLAALHPLYISRLTSCLSRLSRATQEESNPGERWSALRALGWVLSLGTELRLA